MQADQEPIRTITLNGTSITLLGTAHVSKASAEKVRELIETGDYDAVAVELCESRFQALRDPEAVAKMDLFRVIREERVLMVSANLALGAYQQRLAEQFGIEPGAEQRMAIRLSEERDLPILRIDRDIATTLRRVAANIGWFKRLHLFTGLVAGVLTREEISETEIEKLKDGDMLETAFAEFARDREDLYHPMINERDQFMISRLLEEVRDNDFRHILVVIGAGHMKGMLTVAENPPADPAGTIAQLNHLPAKKRWPKYIPWLVVALILTGFAIGFSRDTGLGWEMVRDWVLINGVLSAIGAALAAGHPLTVLTAFVAAPLTSLNPTIGAGMVTAAAELWLRKPKVADFATLRHDCISAAGWWKNRVSRTLLVFIFSSLGSAIGTYVAGFSIFSRLAAA
ncbi:TraB/GumN family protein [Granulosicoccaceae sp. 1_MG-2023]|nr:TraB/GumN family protein [Granulosicoccaceae sp. 1_MG-2023]